MKTNALTEQAATAPLLAGLLAVVIAYLLFMRLPASLYTYSIGFTTLVNGSGPVIVDEVHPTSPAATSGLHAGDVLLAVDGRNVAQWLSLYQSNRTAYLAERYNWRDRPLSVSAMQSGTERSLTMTPRAIGGGEWWIYNGARFSLLAFLIILIMSIILSRSRDASAFLIGVCFCSAILWLASLDPYWPKFMSPLIRGISFNALLLNAIVEAFSIQLVMATLLHVALVFPRRHEIVLRYPWITGAAYFAALGLPFLIMIATPGDSLQRVIAVYGPRLWLNTILLLLITGFMLSTYHHSQDPVQRARTRWIVSAMVLVAIAHIGLWNLPTMLTGSPLVPTYNWLLGPIALIPLALTMSILNHELLGIRGIIRGRLHLLEAQLERERVMVSTRDERIHALSSEISELHNSLNEYRREEAGAAKQTHDTDNGLTRLEQRYPVLTVIRRERLLGASPLWENIFEQTVLASRDRTPVLIVGESGTGKTDIAWSIHMLGNRGEAPYRTISCAQFEHADPAFALGRLFGIGTGHGLPNVAREGRPGLLQECDGGTLVLDDFDRLPLSVQDLLLYPLEGRPFEPGIGSGPSQAVDIKFILATNRDPNELVRSGHLRGDVLARIGARVDLPPLRERPEDIPVLAEHFVHELSDELDHEISIISPRTMNMLARGDYKSGNARELRSVIRSAIGKAMLEDDNILRAGYLSPGSAAPGGTPDNNEPSSSVAETIDTPDTRETDRTTVPDELKVLREFGFRIKPAEAKLGYSHKSRTLSHHLRGLCLQALADNDCDIERAISWLAPTRDRGVHARLRSKLERYQLSLHDHLHKGTEAKLYRNLPSRYRESLETVLQCWKHNPPEFDEQ